MTLTKRTATEFAQELRELMSRYDLEICLQDGSPWHTVEGDTLCLIFAPFTSHLALDKKNSWAGALKQVRSRAREWTRDRKAKAKATKGAANE